VKSNSFVGKYKICFVDVVVFQRFVSFSSRDPWRNIRYREQKVVEKGGEMNDFPISKTNLDVVVRVRSNVQRFAPSCSALRFLFVVVMVTAVLGETDAQRQALYDFYVATNKGQGGWRNSCSGGGWRTMGSGPPVTFCNDATAISKSTFSGLTCDAPNGNITELALTDCNLNGTLTPSLGLLTELQWLLLGSNRFAGTLPPEWGSMRQLQVLNFYDSQVVGTLPPEWSSMTELRSLYLDVNQLFGTLPPAWSSLRRLRYFYLHTNQLSGTLPPEWSAMSGLQFLYLYSNQLSGTLPAQWFVMNELQDLRLFSNQLSGTLPPEWGAMSGLRDLRLLSNRLSGTLPPEWSTMSGLRELHLDSNQLYGTLPPGWPEGMQSIVGSVSFCNVTCRGVVGVNATCNGIGPVACLGMRLWYNCFDLAALPSININNAWNWNSSNLYLGPQRNDCPVPTPTVSVGTSSFTHATIITTSQTMAHSTTVSLTFTAASRSSSVTEEALPSATGTALPAEVPVPPSSRLPVWEGTISTIGAVVGSVAVGAVAAGGSAQRAALQRSLTGCSLADGEPLDIASSPLQLGFGPETGHYVRGAVVFNIVLLAGLGSLALLLCAALAWYRESATDRHRRVSKGISLRRAAASLQLPGILHLPVTFLLQPVVSSSVWCVQSNNVGDVVIGLLGLLVFFGYVLWAVWVVSFGRVGHSVVGVVHSVASRSQRTTPMSVLRRVLLGVQDERTEWVERQPDGTFVGRFAVILCAYRLGRQWFLTVELLVPLVCGVIGGVALAVPDTCGGTGLTVVYLVLLLTALTIALCSQPYNEPLDHVLLVVGFSLSILWALCFLADADDVVLDVLSAAETWLGVAALLAVVIGFFASQRLRTWLSKRLRLIPTAFAEAQQVKHRNRRSLAKMVIEICDAQRAQARLNLPSRPRRAAQSVGAQRLPHPESPDHTVTSPRGVNGVRRSGSALNRPSSPPVAPSRSHHADSVSQYESCLNPDEAMRWVISEICRHTKREADRATTTSTPR
jgi:hypothetical protein